MFKLFFAPRMAKIYYKSAKDKNEKRILEDLYDYYYNNANQIEQELKKSMIDNKQYFNGREQSAIIINEVNQDVIKYGVSKGYPEDLVTLFLQ